MKQKMIEMIYKIYSLGILCLFSQIPSITQGYQKNVNFFKLRPLLAVRTTQLQATSCDKTSFVRRESLLKVLRKLQTNGEVQMRDEYDTSDVTDVILSSQQRPESPFFQSCELIQIAELCSSLAEAGISSADLGVDAFKVIDGLVGSISPSPITPSISNSVINTTTTAYASAGTNLMELLRGLHGMQVRWRILSHATRVNLEAIVAHTLAASLPTYTTSSDQPITTTTTTITTTTQLSTQRSIDIHHKSRLATLVLAMGQLKLAYTDLTPHTRHLLGNINETTLDYSDDTYHPPLTEA